LPGMTAGSDSEVVVRPRHVQDVEEDVGHVLVVVLPGVDQNFLMMLSDLPAHRRGLDELRACADDARDLHGPRERARRLLLYSWRTTSRSPCRIYAVVRAFFRMMICFIYCTQNLL